MWSLGSNPHQPELMGTKQGKGRFRLFYWLSRRQATLARQIQRPTHIWVKNRNTNTNANSSDPLVNLPINLHRFTRTLLPRLGIMAWEKTTANLCREIESITNTPVECRKNSQTEVTSRFQIAIQHTLVSDHVSGAKGALGDLVKSSGCHYVDQDKSKKQM